MNNACSEILLRMPAGTAKEGEDSIEELRRQTSAVESKSMLAAIVALVEKMQPTRPEILRAVPTYQVGGSGNPVSKIGSPPGTECFNWESSSSRASHG